MLPTLCTSGPGAQAGAALAGSEPALPAEQQAQRAKQIETEPGAGKHQGHIQLSLDGQSALGG
jgi:hypothetical protein